MGGYNPLTRSKLNMFDMASLLQKAVRRGDAERAGFAAYELYGGYQGMMWKRILTISAEDCWGVLTKELVDLRFKDEALNQGLTGYSKNPKYVSKAIALLSKAKKSRDACYFACNFILAEPERRVIEYDADEFVARVKAMTEEIPAEAFSLTTMQDPTVLNRIVSVGREEQMAMFGAAPARRTKKDEVALTPNGHDPYEMAALLFRALSLRDMENIGYAAGQLRGYHRMILWKTILAADILFCNGMLTAEIVSLKITDDMVNGRKKPEERDEIFIAKSLMNICYALSKEFPGLETYQTVDLYELIDWTKYRVDDISAATLPDGVIPDWVYDVHTIRGKREGKTDWGMNLVEQEALYPLQVAFFDEGSWAPRYDYKHEHRMCSELEYQMSLEYRMTHAANPASRFDEEKEIEADPECRVGDFRQNLRSVILR